MRKPHGGRKTKGTPKTGGRKKGTPNKLTTSLKDAIQNAFEKVGGESYLVRVARKDPRTFCALLAKVLPTQLEHAGKDGMPFDLNSIDDARLKVEVARRLAFVLQAGAHAAQNLRLTGTDLEQFHA